jgi:hypothetical protein
MALTGCVFALTSNPLVLTLAAVFGTISLSEKKSDHFLYSIGWWVEDCLRLVDLRRFPEFATP